MSDIFKDRVKGLSSPVTDGLAIAPSDTVVLPQHTRGLYVATEGDLSVRMSSGTVLSFGSVQPGVVYPLRVDMVLASGTTVSGIVGLW